MSDGGSGEGVVRTADPVQSPVTTSAPHRRRRRRVYLVAGLVVALLAGGLAAMVNLRDRAPTAGGWRRMVLPTTAQQPESASLVALVSPAASGAAWRGAGSILDTRTGRYTATAWNSPDGRTWQRATIDDRQESAAMGVAERDGLIVVVGMAQGSRDRDGAVWTSRDGTRWAPTPLSAAEGPGDQDVRAVATGPLGFVATGRHRGPTSSMATAFFSPDGSTWRRVGETVFGEGVGVDAVAIGQSGAVAVGWSQVGEEAHGAVWSSSDGVTWVRGALGQGGSTSPVSGVTSIAGGFVATSQEGEGAGRRPVVWRSPDGLQWSRAFTPAIAELPNQRTTGGVAVADLAGGGPLFAVGGGRSEQLWRSADGSEWSRDVLPAQLEYGAGRLSGVAAQRETVVVVASSPGRAELWRREAGKDWAKVSDPSAFPVSAPPATFATLARTPQGLGLFAAGPDDAQPARFGGTAVWTSTDGRTWQPAPDPSGQLRHASLGPVTPWSGGLAVGGDLEDERGDGFVRAMVWTSSDGAAWQRVAEDQPGWNVVGETRIITSVAPLGAGLVAVGVSYSVAGDLDSHVWTSTDARTWTQVPDQPAWRGGGDQALSGVCPLPGGGLVAIGYTLSGPSQRPWAWTSADGQAWSLATGEGAVALEGTGSATARTCVSTPSGVLAAHSVAAPAGRDAAIWSTPDGRSWSGRGNATLFGGQGDQAVTALAVDGSRVVAVGRDDDRAAVWYSLDAGATWRRVPDDRSLFGGFSAYRASGVAIVGDRVVVSGTGPAGAVLWEGRLPRR